MLSRRAVHGTREAGTCGARDRVRYLSDEYFSRLGTSDAHPNGAARVDNAREEILTGTHFLEFLNRDALWLCTKKDC